MINYIPGAGTNGWNDDTHDKSPENRRWWQVSSNFNLMMVEHGLYMYDNPFVWSTDLGGIEFWRRWPIINKFVKKDVDHRDWKAAAAAFSYYIDAYFHNEPLVVIGHSHFYQVVAYACADYGVRVDRLITVSSPIRSDMDEVYQRARKNIGTHLHIYDGGRFTDRIQLLGELGDGNFDLVRECKYADYNDPVGKVNHSRVLSDPEDFHHWIDRGWIEFIKTGFWVPPFPKELEKLVKEN